MLHILTIIMFPVYLAGEAFMFFDYATPGYATTHCLYACIAFIFAYWLSLRTRSVTKPTMHFFCASVLAALSVLYALQLYNVGLRGNRQELQILSWISFLLGVLYVFAGLAFVTKKRTAAAEPATGSTPISLFGILISMSMLMILVARFIDERNRNRTEDVRALIELSKPPVLIFMKNASGVLTGETVEWRIYKDPISQQCFVSGLSSQSHRTGGKVSCDLLAK